MGPALEDDNGRMNIHRAKIGIKEFKRELLRKYDARVNFA
jgi:hypothetical protein